VKALLSFSLQDIGYRFFIYAHITMALI
jgi:hypothetical protein